jgi:hypothetical protein
MYTSHAVYTARLEEDGRLVERQEVRFLASADIKWGKGGFLKPRIFQGIPFSIHADPKR